jgi:hypothetical protein
MRHQDAPLAHPSQVRVSSCGEGELSLVVEAFRGVLFICVTTTMITAAVPHPAPASPQLKPRPHRSVKRVYRRIAWFFVEVCDYSSATKNP